MQNKLTDTEKEILELRRELKALKRAVEGNAGDSTDWLASSRAKVYGKSSAQGTGLSTTRTVVVTQNVRTGGGMMFANVTANGLASNARIGLYLKVDGSTIRSVTFNANGRFAQPFACLYHLSPGTHELKVEAAAITGDGTLDSGGVWTIFFVPGERF